MARLDEAPVLSEEDSALVKGAATPVTEADKAWAALQKALRPPAYPPEWQTTPPTKEQVAEFEKKNAGLAAEAADKARQFYTKYPTNENAAEARSREFDLLKVAVDFGNTNSMARLEAIEQERLKDPSLTTDERLALRVQQIQRIMAGATETTMTNALEKVEKAVRSLQADFPEKEELAGLTMSLSELWLDQGDLQKSRSLAEEVLKHKVDDETKQKAQELVQKLNRIGKPIDVKFTAIDGREVDLQKLKGKVVLVDFWATWCGPCMRELPNVKATYDKLHEKGFEIVGISADEDREALQKVISSEGVTWPQLFEQATTGKKISDEFGVSTLPSMWLVDKKGVLRDIQGRVDLEKKVDKLLAEK